MGQRSLLPPQAGIRICGQHCLRVMRCIFGSMSETAQLMNSFLSCQALAMPTCCRLQWHVRQWGEWCSLHAFARNRVSTAVEQYCIAVAVAVHLQDSVELQAS